MSMRYGWRVPHNTQSVIVREVCQAIVDEYLPEVMNCPTTPQEWLRVSEKFLQKWNFPHTCGALDGKHIACKCPFKSGSQYYNYKHFYSIVLFALVDADYKFIWADLGGTGSASDAQIYNGSELKELAESGSLGLPFSDPLPHDYQDQSWAFKKHTVKRKRKFRNQNFSTVKRKRKFRNQKFLRSKRKRKFRNQNFLRVKCKRKFRNQNYFSLKRKRKFRNQNF